MSDVKSKYDNYFENVLKIHSICARNGLDERFARILSYMYAKAMDSGMGVEYFLSPSKEDRAALEIMLGQNVPVLFPESETDTTIMDSLSNISTKISHLDHLLAEECGVENRLRGELINRLRLYADNNYRDEMIEMYRDIIAPVLHGSSTQPDASVKNAHPGNPDTQTDIFNCIKSSKAVCTYNSEASLPMAK
jgi:hypothetical protein